MPSSNPDPYARQKQQAAERAVEEVRSGMLVGLGTGSTAIFALRRIAELLRGGQLRDIRGFPTSDAIEIEAARLGIPLASKEGGEPIDLTIDGADEVDPGLNVIKGGGGALLHEKIAAQASRRVIIVVDESKLSAALGTLHSLPVEVLPFGWRNQAAYLEGMGAKVALRKRPDGPVFYTDQKNFVLDCDFGPIPNPGELALRLGARAGIVEHGLFIGLASDVIVAGEQGPRRLARSG